MVNNRVGTCVRVYERERERGLRGEWGGERKGKRKRGKGEEREGGEVKERKRAE